MNTSTTTRKLKVGDKVIGQKFVIDTECNGKHGVIIEWSERRKWENVDGSFEMLRTFRVRWADGTEAYVLPPTLRKKPSGRIKQLAKDFAVKTTWQSVGWMPEGVKA